MSCRLHPTPNPPHPLWSEDSFGLRECLVSALQAEEDNLAGSRKKVSGLESLPKVSEEVRPQPLTEKRTFPRKFQENFRERSYRLEMISGNIPITCRKFTSSPSSLQVTCYRSLAVSTATDGLDPTPPLENRRSVADSRVVFLGRRAASSRTRGLAGVDAARAYGARLAYRGSERLR